LGIEDLDARIQQVRKKSEAAALNRLKAQAAKESAEQERAEVLQLLKDKYGIESMEQAKSTLAEKKTSLETLLKKAEDELRDA
jgi:hypothetical protein